MRRGRLAVAVVAGQRGQALDQLLPQAAQFGGVQGGEFVDQQDCPDACSPELGCTACVVGAATCNGNMAHVCNATGTGFEDVLCDPQQGLSCDPSMKGGCVGACAPATLGTSYIGCDYYPTVTAQATMNIFDFAVAVANTGAGDAMVTIEGGALPSPMSFAVPSRHPSQSGSHASTVRSGPNSAFTRRWAQRCPRALPWIARSSA